MSKTRTNTQKLYDIIKKPLVTDKSHQAMENHNQYTFEVAKDATKIEIKNWSDFLEHEMYYNNYYLEDLILSLK